MKRVGIYSGAFDPIHDGHLTFARDAVKTYDLEKVFFLVEPRPRRKQGVKAFEHRVQMVQLAIQGDRKLGIIILEQQRYTPVDTLPVLHERFKGAELYMLLGDDKLKTFADWPHVEELVRSVRFVVGLRTHDRVEVERRLKILQRTRGFMLKYDLLPAKFPKLSSSHIRSQFKRGQVPAGLTPAVLKYIQVIGLYASASTEASDTSATNS